jgi:ribosome-associated protein
LYQLTQRKKDLLLGEVDFQYSRSSGPGGQKVNKTETQVELRWNIHGSQVFKEEQKLRLLEKLKNRFNKSDELIIKTDKYRSRKDNQRFIQQLFFEMLCQALTIPKSRRPTKPTRSSVEKRIQEKKRHSDKKRHRSKQDY